MRKVIVSLILTMLLGTLSYTNIVFASDKQIDYVELFGEFINGRTDFNTNLQDFLMNEYKTCDISYLKDCYMVDMNNNSIPELFCVFCDEWEANEYAVLIEYDNGFKLGAEIPFNYNSGSGGSEFYRILKANGNFYYEKYFSARQDYDNPDGWITKNEIILNKNGEEKIIYSATSNYGINTVNGQQVEEIDYEYVHNNFEIVADGYNYGETWSGYQPQYGKDYAKFYTKEKDIIVTFNGEVIVFDQPPIIIDGRTLVPIRAVIEKMGGTVDWNGNTQQVTLKLGTDTIILTINNATAMLNNVSHTLDVPPQVINSRTLLPIRFIAEGFNFNVDWNGDTQTVIITKDNTINNTENITYKNVTNTMSAKLKDEFNLFVGAEAATAELADYNILENFDCKSNTDVREMIWFHMCGFASSYLKTLPNFKMFDEINTEYYDNGSMRTTSYIPDMIIKEYYNIKDEIPKFEKISDIGSDSLYYSNWYYFANPAYAGTSAYKSYIQSIYDLGNNQYYFSYKLASSLPGSGVFDYVYDDTYYAVMERKHLNNESFSNLEFWSVIKTSTSPILEEKILEKQTKDYSKYVGLWHKVDSDQLNGDIVLDIISVDGNTITFSIDNGDIQTKNIANNQIKWSEEWYDGDMGMTLTLNDNSIHLEYSRYSSEWYKEIEFVK